MIKPSFRDIFLISGSQNLNGSLVTATHTIISRFRKTVHYMSDSTHHSTPVHIRDGAGRYCNTQQILIHIESRRVHQMISSD